jgi:hypothetical protein
MMDESLRPWCARPFKLDDHWVGWIDNRRGTDGG